MYLTQVDAHHVFSSPFFQGHLLFLREVFPDLVGRNGFVLAPRPMVDDGFRQIPFPEQDQGSILPTIGEDEQALVQPNGAALVLDLEVPLAAVWRWGPWCAALASLKALQRTPGLLHQQYGHTADDQDRSG